MIDGTREGRYLKSSSTTWLIGWIVEFNNSSAIAIALMSRKKEEEEDQNLHKFHRPLTPSTTCCHHRVKAIS